MSQRNRIYCEVCRGQGVARAYQMVGEERFETDARPCACSAGARYVGVGLKYADAELGDFDEYWAIFGDEENPRKPTVTEVDSSPFTYGCISAPDALYPGWFVHGETGVGKTYLASAVTRFIALTQGEKVYPYFYSVNDLLADTKTSWDDDHDAQRRLRRLREADVVVLDDLGAEHVSEWATTEITQRVDGWYREEKALFVTSNLTLGGVAERYGERLAGRLADMTRPFHMQGPDRRLAVRR